MKGVSLKLGNGKQQLIATVDTLMLEQEIDLTQFETFILDSEYSEFSLSKDAILSLVEQANQAQLEGNDSVITEVVGKIKRAEITISIASDQMSANLTISKGSTNAVPSLNEIKKLAALQQIKRGLSVKRIKQLITQALEGEPNTDFTDTIAFGLPPRNGKNSFIEPLVPNALDRILAPQETNGGKVDMRNLGEIISVAPNTVVARRMPPTKGRPGKTITGLPVSPIAGEWQDFKIGENTAISESDENSIIATIAGQPKFDKDIMSVDDTYESKGVNVGTGNIDYKGSVIVNGDVTENMQVIATGDITINGFVESALLRAGGDIIITQGATGKMQDEDCRLFANGSVFVQHGQGLDVVCAKDLNVGKQLAYSRVKCKGNVIVGNPDKPLGNLFASNINCYGTLKAGTVGAVSGSSLNVDFSEGMNLLVNRHDALVELLKELTRKNADHEIKISNINNKIIPASLKKKLMALNDQLAAERVLLNWVKDAKQELEDKILQYETNARIIANKELFPGVIIKLNKAIFRAEREYPKCRVLLENKKWRYEPIA